MGSSVDMCSHMVLLVHLHDMGVLFVSIILLLFASLTVRATQRLDAKYFMADTES